ncbi:MAG: protein kinase, partial [Acidobacteriota bacterium]
MTPEQWEKINEIFHSAAALKGDARRAFLDEACLPNDPIRNEIEALLNADSNARDFILNPAINEHPIDGGDDGEPIVIGMTVGHYRIERSIGSGGMGEVYLATDTTLNRLVAFKTLPVSLSGDPLVLRRFRNEAKAAATLNHPNVATIFSVENIADKPHITMEYVEGQTLDNVTSAGGMEIKLFVRLFSQLADAINHAHERGIVHRDLKPRNIMISQDGIPKILDFGLAQTRTVSLYGDKADTDLTQPGQIIGTPAYMSPEQAEGKDVDARSDIFSFGVVMYEAITGKRPFIGESKAEVISNLLKTEPADVSIVRPETPSAIAALITRCIQKPVSERFQSMDEVRNVLANADSAVNAGLSSDISLSRFYKEARSASGVWILAASAIVLVASISGWYFVSGRGFQPPINFESMTIRMLSQSKNVGFAQITRDGKSVVYISTEETDKRSLWIRRIEDKNALQLLPPQPVQFWGGVTVSPDGSQVYYITANRMAQHGTLYRISSLGGTPRKLVETANDLGSISPDGQRVLFVRYGDTVDVISANANDGSDERVICSGGKNLNFRDPQFSADGGKIYVIRNDRIDGVEYRSLVEIPAGGGAETVIIPKQRQRISEIAVLQDGRGMLVNATDPISNLSQIYYVDPASGKQTRITNDLNEYVGVSVDMTGKIIVSAQRHDETTIWAGSMANLASATAVSAEPSAYLRAVWTPDRRIVFDATDNNLPHIFIMDADGSNSQQLTPKDSSDRQPRVSPDGRFIVFTSDRSGESEIWRMKIDGSEPVLLSRQVGTAEAPVISADGTKVYFFWTSTNKRVLGVVPIDGGEVSEMPLYSDTSTNWSFSPDGKRVAYAFWVEAEMRFKVAIRELDGSG